MDPHDAEVVTLSSTIKSGWVSVKSVIIVVIEAGQFQDLFTKDYNFSGQWLVPESFDLHTHRSKGKSAMYTDVDHNSLGANNS
jgi:alpha-D-ribose 1-methylphosphonate 5-triphosphate diphosphatase PhnM